MLVTDDDAVFERVMQLRDHGRAPGDIFFKNEEVAFKYKLAPVAAAIGLAQVERADELVARKREIFGWYHEALDETGEIVLNHEPAGTKNSYWMVTAQIDPALGWPKEKLMAALSEQGIDSRPFFNPLSSLPAYDGRREALAAQRRNMVSHRLAPWGINLPSASCLSQTQVERVVRTLCEVLGVA